MSWSITFNEISKDTAIPPDVVEGMLTQHIQYGADMMAALTLAKRIGMKSGTLTGMRTPNPYGGPEVIDISVRGLIEATDFNQEIIKILGTGPDGEDKQAAG